MVTERSAHPYHRGRRHVAPGLRRLCRLPSRHPRRSAVRHPRAGRSRSWDRVLSAGSIRRTVRPRSAASSIRPPSSARSPPPRRWSSWRAMSSMTSAIAATSGSATPSAGPLSAAARLGFRYEGPVPQCARLQGTQPRHRLVRDDRRRLARDPGGYAALAPPISPRMARQRRPLAVPARPRPESVPSQVAALGDGILNAVPESSPSSTAPTSTLLGEREPHIYGARRWPMSRERARLPRPPGF